MNNIGICVNLTLVKLSTIMNQNKIKFIDSQDQPRIRDFCQTPKDQRIQRLRSNSVKHKKPPTPTSNDSKQTPKKLVVLTDSETESEPETMSEESKQKKDGEEILAELDKSVIKALEKQLQPIRDDIKGLRKEVKEDVANYHQLKEENRQLHHWICEVEIANEKLTKKVSDLENKMLSCNVILHGIQKSPWETESVRQEKIYLAISETLISRTLEQCLETARRMCIKGSRHIGAYQAMKTRPISIEFLYKSDAEYLLNNWKYLGQGVFVDTEYCKEIENCHKILRPYLKAVRIIPKYQKKCRLDEDTLVL